jgi:HAD superfamily hydrolase (TIGR01509 family)
MMPRLSAVSTPELVIFDCDGVLVDSEAVSSTVLAQALCTAGAPTTAQEAHARYRGSLPRDISEDVRTRSGILLSEDFWVDFERDRALAFEKTLLPIHGAAETVAVIKAAGIAVCVASQGKREKTELTLGLTGLRGLFGERAIFSAYDVPRGKPHPDLFLHAALEMGTPVASCIVVEDTTIGIRAALAGDMRAIGLASDPEAECIRRLGATTIESLLELPPLLLNPRTRFSCGERGHTG